MNTKLYLWLRANTLTLNINKTYYMIFHRARIKSKDFALGISINKCALKEVENCKYLGIILIPEYYGLNIFHMLRLQSQKT